MKRYEHYFGTPEKAAKTLSELITKIDTSLTRKKDLTICELWESCINCPARHMYCIDVVSWLNEEMD